MAIAPEEKPKTEQPIGMVTASTLEYQQAQKEQPQKEQPQETLIEQVIQSGLPREEHQEETVIEQIKQPEQHQESASGFSLSALDKMLEDKPEKIKLELNEYCLHQEWIDTVNQVDSNTIREIASSNKPWLIGDKIYFHLKSDYEKSVVESCLKSLFEHLHEHYADFVLEAEIKIFPDETNQNTIPITPKDKYKAMLEQNPNLKDMVDQLKLKLDY